MKNSIASSIKKTIIENLNEREFTDLFLLVMMCKKHITPEYAFSKYRHHSNATKQRDPDVIISEGYYYSVISVLCQLTKSGIAVKEGIGRKARYKLKGI